MRGRLGRGLGLPILVLSAALLSVSAASAGTAGTTIVRIPLPPPNSVRISTIVVTSATRPVPSALNAAQLGSRQGNTQVVAVVKSLPKSTYYIVYVFIHRFPAVYRRMASASGGPTEVSLALKNLLKDHVDAFVRDTPCDDTGILPYLQKFVAGGDIIKDDVESGLKQNGFYGDSWTKKERDEFTMTNAVPVFDTDTEEQIDNAVHTKCPDAEKPDTGSQ
jgi:hypothetical protein